MLYLLCGILGFAAGFLVAMKQDPPDDDQASGFDMQADPPEEK